MVSHTNPDWRNKENTDKGFVEAGSLHYIMTEKGYKGGLVSRVRNKISGKRYVISTAQEIGMDYWTTAVFPTMLFGLLPRLTKAIFSIVRNNKDDAHKVHWMVKDIVQDSVESEWFEKIPNPQPEEGWSLDAVEKLRKHGVEP